MKIAFATPVVYDGNDSRYLQRDAVRHIEYLKQHGHDGVKIILDDGSVSTKPQSPYLIAATWQEWCSEDFWKAQNADAAVLYGGLSPRFLPVAQIIKKLDMRLILKMDSALGPVHFPKFAYRIARRRYFGERMTKSAPRAAFVAFANMLKSALGKNNAPLKNYLSQFDVIAAESNFSAGNARHWLVREGLPDCAKRVAILPHPVYGEFSYDGLTPKKKQIIAVALDWRNPNKGGELLARTLAQLLSRHNDYRAVIVGKYSDEVKNLAMQKLPSIASRIDAVPPMPAREICDYYTASQMFLLTSGSEGSPNVVAESLCCGCSLVATPEMFQLEGIFERGDGTIARHRNSTSLADALELELTKWQSHPDRGLNISQHWGDFFHVAPATEKLLYFIFA